MKSVRLLAIICLAFTLLSTAVHSYQAPAYFGIDGLLSHIPFENQYGGNITPKTIPGINPFVGVSITPYLSVEAAYQYSRGSRTVTLAPGDWVAGFAVPMILAPITFKSRIILQGPSISLFLTTPCLKEAPFQLFFGVGISHLKANIGRKTMQYNAYVGSTTRVLESCRAVARVTAVGGNYFFSPDFAIRVSATFSNTKQLHQFVYNSHYSFIKQEMKAKNSIVYSIGLRWGF